MKKIMIILLMVLLTACSDSSTANRALAATGYTNIQTNGYAFFGCSEDDVYHTSFTATGPTGVKVEGVVCSGVFKGSTIRLN